MFLDYNYKVNFSVNVVAKTNCALITLTMMSDMSNKTLYMIIHFGPCLHPNVFMYHYFVHWVDAHMQMTSIILNQYLLMQIVKIAKL